jgi:hypothetical protein
MISYNCFVDKDSPFIVKFNGGGVEQGGRSVGFSGEIKQVGFDSVINYYPYN